MKLVIFGATGGTGQQLVTQALAAGHEVTAVARDPAAIKTKHERLSVVPGDVTSAASVAGTLAGQTGAICAIGPRKGSPPGTLISDSVRNILAGLKQHGGKHFVLESGLMMVDGRALGFLARIGVSIFRRLNMALYRDKLVAETLTRESGLSWTIVRPPQFDARAPRGSYRLGENLDAKVTAMSNADVASALLATLAEPKYQGKAVEVSY